MTVAHFNMQPAAAAAWSVSSLLLQPVGPEDPRPMGRTVPSQFHLLIGSYSVTSRLRSRRRPLSVRTSRAVVSTPSIPEDVLVMEGTAGSHLRWFGSVGPVAAGRLPRPRLGFSEAWWGLGGVVLVGARRALLV